MRGPSNIVAGLGIILAGTLAVGLSSLPSTVCGQSPRILQGVETDDYEAVGIVGSLQLGGFCSGTLITDSHVLTAAHCATVIEGPNSGTFELFGRVYETVDVFIHPDYNPVSLANDIAILQLDEPVIEALPAEIFRGQPLVGDLLFIVGYGGTGTAEGGSDGSFGSKRVGMTTIDEVTSTLVSWTYDDASEANTATGDSGGPGYLDIDGDLFIACITSGGTEPDSSLGDFAFNTRVDAFADWIDFTIAASLDDQPPADEPPAETPQDDPVADDGNQCDSFLSCLFGTEVSPFPILQLLIDALTTILDWLNQVEAELEQGGVNPEPPVSQPPDTELPTEPQPGDGQPGDGQPGGEQPTEEQPVDCPVTEEPVTAPPVADEPGTENPINEEPPVTEDPVTDLPITELPVTELPVPELPVTELPEIPGGFGQGGSTDTIQLPPADASELEIRRWILEHPHLKELVEHRL